jgi:hypothetical protein
MFLWWLHSRNLTEVIQIPFSPIFELFFQVIFTTCKGTSNFGIQVSQTKFTLWKMISRKNFGELMDFFLKGLNPFKIQTCFKLEFFLEFIILNPFGI